MISLTIVLISVAFGVILFAVAQNDRRGNFPPGPFALPLIGNLLSMGRAPYKAFFNWAKKYGKIYTMKFGRERVVVLSDAALIREAFNNPKITARPNNHGISLDSEPPHGLINTSSQEWMDQRRFTLRHLREFGFGKNAMEDIVMEEVNELICTLKSSEGHPTSLMRRFNLIVFNALWKIMSGERYSHDDPKLSKLLDNFNELRTGSGARLFLVALVPSLAKLFPEASGWNNLLKTINDRKEFALQAISEHKTNIPEDGPRDFIDTYLEEIKATSDQSSSFYKDAGLKSLVAVIMDLFTAGSETTALTLTWTFLYLTKFPDIQKQLQYELDRKIGKNRQVTLADRPNLPYAEAACLEILRYSSIFPFGLFHATSEDVEFHGYQLPKGTCVLPNIYFVHFNEQLWDSPNKFNPERFLTNDGNGIKVKRSENLIPFSVGKRQCLGETLARDELFLFTTNIFQQFNVRLNDDCLNIPAEPKPGPAMEPHPFNVVFSDRL